MGAQLHLMNLRPWQARESCVTGRRRRWWEVWDAAQTRASRGGIGSRGATAHCIGRMAQTKLTNLVVDLFGRNLEVDGLFKDVALLFELDTLGPVVKGTGYVDFFRGVFPARRAARLDRVRVEI